MNKIAIYRYLGTVLLSVVLIGCAKTQHLQPRTEIRLRGTDQAELMRAAHDVLVRMHFSIEKADPNAGYIRTRPLPAAQFFEFWRTDNVGASNVVQANLHSIRRTAELNITQKANESVVACNVQVQRLSLPEQPVTSSSRAYAMFSESTASMQTLRLNPEQKGQMAWIDLPEDAGLAAAILERIKDQIKGPDRSQAPQTNHEARATRDKP
jgi:hypothetical protein